MRNSISLTYFGRRTMITRWNLSGNMTCRMWYIYSGSGTYTWKGKTYPLRPKHLYIFPANGGFNAQSDFDFPIDHLYFDFFVAPSLPNVCEPKVIKIDWESGNWQGSAIDMMNYAVDEICSVSKSLLNINRELLVYRVINSGVSTLFDWAFENEQYGDIDTEMVSAAEYINANFKQNISISKMAESYGLSTDYFIRRFKKAFETTPHSYLLNIRRDVAQIMRKDKSIPLERIAEETGFSSASAMLHALKRGE